MPMVQPDEDGTTCAFAAATESQWLHPHKGGDDVQEAKKKEFGRKLLPQTEYVTIWEDQDRQKGIKQSPSA